MNALLIRRRRPVFPSSPTCSDNRAAARTGILITVIIAGAVSARPGPGSGSGSGALANAEARGRLAIRAAGAVAGVFVEEGGAGVAVAESGRGKCQCAGNGIKRMRIGEGGKSWGRTLRTFAAVYGG